MHLPVNPPFLPMLAKRVERIAGRRNMDLRAEVGRLSRAGLPRRRRDPHPEPRRKAAQPLLSGTARAAPLTVARPLRARRRNRRSRKNGALDFEALQLRLHPAASRVKLLSQEIPASIVFFDLLCEGDRDLRGMPFQERRASSKRCLRSQRRRST